MICTKDLLSAWRRFKGPIEIDSRLDWKEIYTVQVGTSFTLRLYALYFPPCCTHSPIGSFTTVRIMWIRQKSHLSPVATDADETRRGDQWGERPEEAVRTDRWIGKTAYLCQIWSVRDLLIDLFSNVVCKRLCRSMKHSGQIYDFKFVDKRLRLKVWCVSNLSVMPLRHCSPSAPIGSHKLLHCSCLVTLEIFKWFIMCVHCLICFDSFTVWCVNVSNADVLAVWLQDQAISARELQDVLNGVLSRSEWFLHFHETSAQHILAWFHSTRKSPRLQNSLCLPLTGKEIKFDGVTLNTCHSIINLMDVSSNAADTLHTAENLDSVDHLWKFPSPV